MLYAPLVNMKGTADDDKPISCRSKDLTVASEGDCAFCALERYLGKSTLYAAADQGPNTKQCMTCDFFGQVGCRVDSDNDNVFDYIYTDGYGKDTDSRNAFVTGFFQNTNDNMWRFQKSAAELTALDGECATFVEGEECLNPTNKRFQPQVCAFEDGACIRRKDTEMQRPLKASKDYDDNAARIDVLNVHIDLNVILRSLPTQNETVIVKPRRSYGKSGNDISTDVVDLGVVEDGRLLATVTCAITNPNSNDKFDRCPELIFWGWTGDDPRCNTDTGKWCNKAILRKSCYGECDKCPIDRYQPEIKSTGCIACLRGQNAAEGQERCDSVTNKVCTEKTLQDLEEETKTALKNMTGTPQDVAEAMDAYNALMEDLTSCDNGLFPDDPNIDFASKKDVESKCDVEKKYGRKLVPGLGSPWMIDYSFNNYYDLDEDGLISEEEYMEFKRIQFGAAFEEFAWKTISGGPDAKLTLEQFKQILFSEKLGFSPVEYNWQGQESNKTVDECSVAEHAWMHECRSRAINLCTHGACKSQLCAANQRPPTSVLHIYNKEVMAPWMEREVPLEFRENGSNTTVTVPEIPDFPDNLEYPFDLYGKAAPPRWFKIEWDPPEFVNGKLLYYFVEITSYMFGNDETGDFNDGDGCGTNFPETSHQLDPTKDPDMDCYDPNYYPQGFPLPSSRVEASCGRIEHSSDVGKLNPPCQLLWKVDKLPHLKNYFFRVLAVIDYYDSDKKKQIYARAVADEYKKFERWKTADTCIAASPEGWVTSPGEYLETRRDPTRIYDKAKDRHNFKLTKEHAWRYEEDLQDPWEWRCLPCPIGADCRNCAKSTGTVETEEDRCYAEGKDAPRAWWELRGLMGSWRPSRTQQLQFMTGKNYLGVEDGALLPNKKSSLNNQLTGHDGFVDRLYYSGKRGDFDKEDGETEPIDKTMYPYTGTHAARRHAYGGVIKWYRCPYRQACLGSENPPEVDRYYMNGTDLEAANLAERQLTERCATEHGHTGIACAICFQGSHYMTSTGCATCKEITGGSVGVKLTVIFLVLAGSGLILYKFRSLRYVAKDLSRVGKILVNFIQVMSAIKDVYTLEIPSMNVGFNFAQYFSMFNFDLIELFGIPCLIQMTYYQQYVADMSVIFMMVFIVIIVYIVVFLILQARDANGGKERRSRKKLQKILASSKKQKAALEARLEEMEHNSDEDTDSDDSDEEGKKKDKASKGGNNVLAMFGAKAGPGGKVGGKARWTGLKKGLFSVRSFRKSKMSALVRLKAICSMAAYYVFLFQHQPSSVKTFNMFKCLRIEGTLWLRPDLRLTCFPFNGYHYFAMFMMAFYVFGFPTFTLYVLYKRRNMLADPIVVAQYGFLYTPYKPHAYWWEAQIIVHKMALTAGLVLLYQSAIVQCSAAFALSVMSWAMHSNYKPFKSDRLNLLQHWCLFATSIAFIGNLAYQCTANSTEGEASSKGIVKWFITFMFMGAILRVLIGGCQETMRAWKNYEEIMLGKRQEKKLAAEKKARERKGKKAKTNVVKTNGSVAVLPVGGARRLTKMMPTLKKLAKKNAKMLGVYNKSAGGKKEKKGGLLGALKASKGKAKVTMVSV
jgi:hypothetical protein